MRPAPGAVVLAFAAAALVAGGRAAPAGGEGFAYDGFSAIQFVQSSPAPIPTPGNFDAEFKRASQTPSPVPSSPASPADLARVASAQFKAVNTATRRYVLDGRERIDNVVANTSTIRDCSARTLTTINNASKTYTVESLDAPPPAASPVSSPAATASPLPFALPSGIPVNVKAAIETRTIAQQRVDGEMMDGFAATGRLTGGTAPFAIAVDGMMTNYVTRYAQDRAKGLCSARVDAPAMPPLPAGFPSLSSLIGDWHIAFTYDGPALPSNRISAFTVVRATVTFPQFGTRPLAPLTVTVETRNGHFRRLGDADQPLFTIPAGYTQVQKNV